MSNIVVWSRKPFIVNVKPEWKWNMLHVANQLARVGFHMETALHRGVCFFGSLPSDVDPEKAFGSVTEVASWKEG